MLSITIFAGSPLLTGLIIGAVINLLLLTLAANTEQQVLSAPASASNKLHAVTLSATAGPQKPYRHRTHAADKTGTSACG
ncbi:MAG: hypothetical protein GY868_14325 [Deltaproteobacteria bacterium]|nr:hypothetical protein [Deltaproteobacteria bacterium]